MPKIVTSRMGFVTHLFLFTLLSASFAVVAADNSRCASQLLPAVPGSANVRTRVEVGSLVDFIEEAKVPDHLYEVHAPPSPRAAEILADRVHFDTPATRAAIAVMLEVSEREHAPLSLARLVNREPYASLSLDLTAALPSKTHLVRVHARSKAQNQSMRR